MVEITDVCIIFGRFRLLLISMSSSQYCYATNSSSAIIYFCIYSFFIGKTHVSSLVFYRNTVIATFYVYCCRLPYIPFYPCCPEK